MTAAARLHTESGLAALEVAPMKKVLATSLVLAVCSFVVGGMLMWPEAPKASAAVSQPAAPVPPLDAPPVVVETSAVLVLAPKPQEAPKPRPVAARPKAKPAPQGGGRVDCSNAKYREREQTALGTGVVYCHN